MRYKPSSSEIDDINNYDQYERLQYFLTRTIESEEVWGIGDHKSWRLKTSGDQDVLQVWPYECLVQDYLNEETTDIKEDAISLEQFVYHVLQTVRENNIAIEVLPTRSQDGMIVTAEKLLDLFEGMMDAGDYYLEG